MGREVHIVQANDFEQVFTETSVGQLVKDAKVRVHVDIGKLRGGLIDAAKRYSAERGRDGNALHREIKRLHAAAQHKRFDAAAAALVRLSAPARDILSQRDPPRNEGRLAADGQDAVPTIGLAQRTEETRAAQVPEAVTRRRREDRRGGGSKLPPLPQPADLLDPATRDKACEAIIDRCEIGGRWVPGRNRPSGRRSWTWEPVLWAPELNPHPENRGAERTFIMWLQIAWIEATGANVPRTAHAINPGPFARLAKKALALLGAPHANAVQLINDLERSRNDHVTSQDVKDSPDSTD